MTIETAVDLARRALLVTAELSAPLLVAGLVVGLVFALFQAMTQIHEQTLSSIPKMLAMAALLFALLPWFLGALVGYAREVLEGLGRVGLGP